jgi:predicted TIM-barrel fold metal-dependent hydrolase
MARADRYPSHREPDGPAPLPFVPGEVSNGEFVPGPVSARDREIVRLTLRRAEVAAERVGMDRRRFLQTTGGMAVMLAAVNACASTSDPAAPAGPSTTGAPTNGPKGTAGTSAPAPGGTFVVPPPEDTDACEHVLGNQGEFILDVHTHHVMPDGPWRQSAPSIVSMLRDVLPVGCVEADPFTCLDRQHYVQDLFLASDTTVSLVSDVPNSGPADAPLPFTDAIRTHEFAAALTGGGEPRVLVQSVLAPNFGELAPHLDLMSQQVETGKVSCFKVYTAWGPGQQGYRLDDPAIGIPVLERAHDLGVKVVCAHKGLPIQGFDQRFNAPDDVVAVAKRFPDMSFVVYHSAFERETTEGPYDPTRALRGVSALIKALDDHGLPKNSNVYAELGTTWRETMSAPTAAAHVLGKLLSRVGEDRVLWGTDAIWYGSPQPQIMAFRAFEITAEFQERFGYPALTPEIKQKIFGLNAAKLFGLDVAATRCAVDATALAAGPAAFRSLVDDGWVREPWRARAPLTRREMLGWLRTTPPSNLPW